MKIKTYSQQASMKIKNFLIAAVVLGGTVATAVAQNAKEIKWSEAFKSGDPVSGFIRGIVVVVMAIFIMVSLILGSLAFKQLAADGNWKDFWSKIAGAVGMFVTPVAIYWFMR